MQKTSRRISVYCVSPERVNAFSQEQNPWHETQEEIQRGFRDAQERARQLQWIKRMMGRRLSTTERQCVELYFFEGLTYREIARRTERQTAGVHRAIRCALAKLQLSYRRSCAAQRARSKRVSKTENAQRQDEIE